jgi:hypothetical protein
MHTARLLLPLGMIAAIAAPEPAAVVVGAPQRRRRIAWTVTLELKKPLDLGSKRASEHSGRKRPGRATGYAEADPTA